MIRHKYYVLAVLEILMQNITLRTSYTGPDKIKILGIVLTNNDEQLILLNFLPILAKIEKTLNVMVS